ncbi:globin domain-containing protein [Mycolicibacterium brumae]|uniref:nitric oxide dioxygenase n=1 Tax=Mycolicibacterium brumae TaxID=85968 RepID=A0A2G5PGY3_9MYCO|nr:globin domain-containing protein [Mycolicibacterium brumae]MCV7192407.1 hemin transporter [Mycolicibacterium brumae]PIB77572.1 hemin transporter [Mycolicibacterium brumae]RWA18601.1 hypothetical protein MBRU_05105 [Mycolicibacterium brumae DSM 44177]UWW10175.1 globin domain-containing protein [Mycolicibacterium brumae]
MTVAVERAELSAEHAEVIRATLPLVGAHIDEITRAFYNRMFAAHPELLRNLFNRGNQAQGAQQKALAASVATFATHLVDPDLPHPAELMTRIAHKHTSLGIVAEQYPIVHEHLFAAIVAVLGADVVTEDVAEAWDRVFWIMADALIGEERALYADAGVAPGDVFHRLRVSGRVDDPSGVVLVTVAAPGIRALPGQYVSVGVTLPDGARQLRQYSLVGIDGDELTFAVKPVRADGGCPAGEVSTWIRANVRVGDLLEVTTPFGDLPTPATDGTSLMLISAGIGITPMISILQFLAERAPQTPVLVCHADRSPAEHPLAQRQRDLVAALPNADLELWYEDDAGDAHHGRMSLRGVPAPAEAQVYLCGPDAFIRGVREQVLAAGVPAERLHCELFSPNDWLLG